MGVEVMRAKYLPFWGVDLCPEDRPGVPREAAPHPLQSAHWMEPAQQPIEGRVLKRAGLTRPTPVFSTALPPRGVSGVLRRIAYRIPDHEVWHWATLLIADRVDVIENLGSLLMMRPLAIDRARPAASKRRQRR